MSEDELLDMAKWRESRRKFKSGEMDERFETYKIKGKLVFKEAPSHETKFNQQTKNIRVFTDAEKGLAKVVAELQTEHGSDLKLYQVKNRQIEFVTQHKILLPGTIGKTLDYLKFITEKDIFYKIKSWNLGKSKETLDFLEKNNIDKEKKDRLVFECGHGAGIPKTQEFELIGSFNKRFGGLTKTRVIKMFHCRKAHHNRRLCFAYALRPNSSQNGADIEWYLAEFGKNNKNVLKRKVKIDFCCSRFESYQRKLQEDKERVPETFIDSLKFFDFENTLWVDFCEEIELRFKWSIPIILVEKEMITVSIFDLKSQKVVFKRLISVYELFEGLEFAKTCKLGAQLFDIEQVKEVYSPKLDVLVIEMPVKLEYDLIEGEGLPEVIIKSMKSGRTDRKNLTKFTRNNEGIIAFEEKKLRFKVFNILKGKERRVEVENVELGANSGFTVASSRFFSYYETASKVELEVISPGATHGSHKTSLMIFEGQNRLPDHGIKEAFHIDDDLFLLACTTKLLLLDAKSQSVISTHDYCSPHPVESFGVHLFDGDLMVTKHPKISCLELHRLSGESEEAPFESLGLIDLTHIDNFHSIEELHDLRKAKENSYEVRATLNLMDEGETTFFNPYTFTIAFSLSKEGEGQAFLAKINYAKPHYKIEGWRSTSVNGLQWNSTSSNEGTLSFTQMNQSPVEDNGPDPSPILRGKIQIQGSYLKSHIKNDQIYILSEDRPQENQQFFVSLFNKDEYPKTLKLVQFKADDRTTEIVSEFEEIKSIRFPKFVNVNINEKADSVRIIACRRHEWKHNVKIDVFNETLEATHKIYFDKFCEPGKVVMISPSQFYVSSTNTISFGESQIERCVLVDTEDKTFIELKDESGKPVFAVPFICKNGKYLALTLRSFYTNWSKAEGVYFSNFVELPQ